MRLIYAYDGKLPSAAANSVNVTKTCAALAAEGHRVLLVHNRGSGDIFRHYALADRFGTLALPFDLLRKGAVRLQAWTAALIARPAGALVYSRKAPLILPAARIGCPVALEVHSPLGPAEHRSRAAFSELLERNEMRAVICISQALADHLAQEWPQSRKLLVVAHDGADPASVAEPARPRRERPLLAYAGHLYPGKGMETIAALALLRHDWDFLVIGGRPEDVEHWRKQIGTLSNVEFAGMIPHSQVLDRLGPASVLLAPYGRTVIVSDLKSDVSKWMSPLKLFEYMALAKPIVASDLPVIREVLEDGRNARLATPGDPEHWERVIDEVLAKPTEAVELGQRAREDLERRYNWRCRARAIAQALSR